MKRTISALVVIGLLGVSTPISQAAETRAGVKLVKINKKAVKRSSIKYSPKSVTAAYVTMDTSTALAPTDTRTATLPVETRTAVVPTETKTVIAPAPAPIVSSLPAASLSGEQLIKILELFAKLSARSSTNANTTTNNVVTPITVAPQVITQTIVAPTVSAPTIINQPMTISQPLPIVAQALALLSYNEHEDEDDETHEKHK